VNEAGAVFAAAAVAAARRPASSGGGGSAAAAERAAVAAGLGPHPFWLWWDIMRRNALSASAKLYSCSGSGWARGSQVSRKTMAPPGQPGGSEICEEVRPSLPV